MSCNNGKKRSIVQRGAGGCRGPQPGGIPGPPGPACTFVGGLMGGMSNNTGLWLAAGSNISLVSSMGPQGMTIWINGLGGTGPIPSVSSSTWTMGMPNQPIITGQALSLVAGSNITLQVAT